MGTQKDHRRRVIGALGAMVMVVCLSSTADSTAIEPTRYEPLPSFAFTPVSVSPAPAPVPVVLDRLPGAPPVATALPRRPQAAPRLGVVEKQPSRSSGLSFTATYYCLAGESRCHYRYPDGPEEDLYAAISPDYAQWRGDRVKVCNGERCVTVTIIDCNCEATQAIDLYADAFKAISDLWRGRIKVTVTPL